METIAIENYQNLIMEIKIAVILSMKEGYKQRYAKLRNF